MTKKKKKYPTPIYFTVCNICGIDKQYHPFCEACGIIIGKGHQYEVIYYKDKKLCSNCVKDWQHYDSMMGRETKFEEFNNPKNIELTIDNYDSQDL